jgi:putative glycosyltransferase
MMLSIVTTLYKSSPYVSEFYERVSKQAQKITDNYEIIFVDDGSPDDSLQKCIALHKHDQKVTIIELSRNFGHHKALMTGLSHAKGDFVFLIDSDLEEEPELLGSFWQELQNHEDLDLVFGVQERRKGKWFERFSGHLFFKVLNYLNEVKTPENFLTVRLMRKIFLDNLISFKEKEVVFSVINSLTGFKSKKYLVKKEANSPSTYTLKMKFKLLLDAIVSSTPKPLWIIFNVGLLITLASSIYIFFLMYNKFFNDAIVDGWTSVMILISFFGGLIIFFLGVIGLYLSKVFIEVKQRPYSIIRKKYQSNVDE